MNKDNRLIINLVYTILFFVSIGIGLESLALMIIIQSTLIITYLYMYIRYKKINYVYKKINLKGVPEKIEILYNSVNSNQKTNKKAIYIITNIILLMLVVLIIVLISNKYDVLGTYIVAVMTCVFTALYSLINSIDDNTKEEKKIFMNNVFSPFFNSLYNQISYRYGMRSYLTTTDQKILEKVGKRYSNQDETAKLVADICENTSFKKTIAYLNLVTIDNEISWVGENGYIYNLVDVIIAPQTREYYPFTYLKSHKYADLVNGLVGWLYVGKSENIYLEKVDIRIGLKGLFEGENSKITINNDEFEKYFSVHSNNEEDVKKILTNELIDFLVKFFKESHLMFFITIKNNNIFFDFYTGRQAILNRRNMNNNKRYLYCYYYATKLMEGVTNIIYKQELKYEETEKNMLDDYFDNIISLTDK